MEKLIHISHNNVLMEGMLSLSENMKGIVLFAHGSGSSRLSPRNNYVAKVLQQGGFGTLLIDLLSEEEDSVYETRFNIPLLSERLEKVVRWLQKNKETKDVPIALFGASTGAASALEVAAKLGDQISAVVSRGGRADLAYSSLNMVQAPTLLIVGELDFEVLELNQKAFKALSCIKKIEIVSKATHLFEEPGALEEVAALSTKWFLKHVYNYK